MKRQFKQ